MLTSLFPESKEEKAGAQKKKLPTAFTNLFNKGSKQNDASTKAKEKNVPQKNKESQKSKEKTKKKDKGEN